MSISIYVIVASAIKMLMICYLIYWRHASVGGTYCIDPSSLRISVQIDILVILSFHKFGLLQSRFSGLVIVMQSLLYNQIISFSSIYQPKSDYIARLYK